jgi:hypothetical protein
MFRHPKEVVHWVMEHNQGGTMTRYLSNLALGVLGAFLVVATFAFAVGTFATLMFAIAIAATLVGLGMAAGIHDRAQRGIGALAAVVAIWTIVASLVFVPATALWLGFASALALAGLAIVGLTVHELTVERVVHSLDVAPESAPRERERVAA